jgi:CTP synthase
MSSYPCTSSNLPFFQGGTIGDIENMPFVEALTQLRHKSGKGNFVTIQVSLVPVVNGEQKTKPTQHAVKCIRSAGLIPDLVSA